MRGLTLSGIDSTSEVLDGVGSADGTLELTLSGIDSSSEVFDFDASVGSVDGTLKLTLSRIESIPAGRLLTIVLVMTLLKKQRMTYELTIKSLDRVAAALSNPCPGTTWYPRLYERSEDKGQGR